VIYIIRYEDKESFSSGPAQHCVAGRNAIESTFADFYVRAPGSGYSSGPTGCCAYATDTNDTAYSANTTEFADATHATHAADPANSRCATSPAAV
jgi:hypothetical protein